MDNEGEREKNKLNSPLRFFTCRKIPTQKMDAQQVANFIAGLVSNNSTLNSSEQRLSIMWFHI